MVSREEILTTVCEFFDVNLGGRSYHRISRLKDDLETRLDATHEKLRTWFQLEKDTGGWVIFRAPQEKSLFHQSFSLKKAVLYIKSAMRSIGYDMVYATYPGSKVITFTNLNADAPIELLKMDPPRPFTVKRGTFTLRFRTDATDEFHYDP
jgi:hypothetical protein